MEAENIVHHSRLGVDTGGTFTDFVWLDENGRFHIHKQLSTPHNPSEAILLGIQTLQVPETTEIVHGSTVATNALLERKGAKTALITTKGFADVLEIGRQNRPDIYALVPQKPPPLVPRQWRFEVNERVTAQGDILIPLDSADLHPILAQLAADGIESVAVCLLFSFLRPEHEQQLKEVISNWVISNLSITQLPFTNISLSSEILPEYREYERTSTTVINAYVAPLMARYLSQLVQKVQPRRLAIMQSNGGIISAETAVSQAARTALSGPAGGVVGARFVAGQAGFADIITFDMGGTSTDVALCPGRLPTTTEGEIIGMPLRLPIIDIHTVGAGGGSLAYVDAGGALHVGPQSAGAEPGPACYRKDIGDWRLDIEGKSPIPNIQYLSTTTDANLVLGRLDAGHFLGGTMQLNEEAARVVLGQLAEAMGTETAESAAWGVIQVANATMERAIRRISVERGFDPRLFTLVAFGGAGPLHACEMAASLQIPRVLIPQTPGVLSALGMLAAAPTKDYSQTVLKEIGDWGLEIGDWLQTQFGPLEARAMAEMVAEGHDPATLTLQRSLDMRYAGQSHELRVLIPNIQYPIPNIFHEAHQKRYGYHQPAANMEIVTIRITAVSPTTPPVLPTQPASTSPAAAIGEKTVWFNQQPTLTTLYDRASLRPGHQFSGPAIIFQYDTTTVVPPGWETAVDEQGNLICHWVIGS